MFIENFRLVRAFLVIGCASMKVSPIVKTIQDQTRDDLISVGSSIERAQSTPKHFQQKIIKVYAQLEI